MAKRANRGFSMIELMVSLSIIAIASLAAVQAQVLASALESLSGFRSAQDIHAELRRRGERIGLTTVYRHLMVLSEDGAVIDAAFTE